MAVKLADTLAPMGDFPAAESSSVEITLTGGTKKSVQKAYEDGDLGGIPAVETMPESANNGSTVLYVGEGTAKYKKGHTYQAKDTLGWASKAWTGLTSLSGTNVWTDGENIYYSSGSSQYVLNKAISIWLEKVWTGLTSFNGSNVWTDGEHTYYSNESSQYVLDKATSTWSEKVWTGLTSFNGSNVWTDGDNTYYSSGSSHFVLDKANSAWTEKVWTGLTSFAGYYVWTDGTDFYYSYNTTQYVLDKANSAWTEKVWTGLTSFNGSNVWTDGENIYYSCESSHFVLDKANSTWARKVWIGPTLFDGKYVWTDGENTYYSAGGAYQYKLQMLTVWADITPSTEVDQTYDPTSANAQSGIAVAQAVASKASVKTYYIAPQSGKWDYFYNAGNFGTRFDLLYKSNNTWKAASYYIDNTDSPVLISGTAPSPGFFASRLVHDVGTIFVADTNHQDAVITFYREDVTTITYERADPLD